MGVDASTLMSNLIPAQQNDRTSYNHIVEALRRKNPTLKVWLTVNSTAELLGADEIEVTLTGSSSATEGPITLNDGQWDTFLFRMNDVIDPGDIDSSSVITVSARDTGTISNDPNTRDWHYPFASTDRNYSMSGGSGDYEIMVELI